MSSVWIGSDHTPTTVQDLVRELERVICGSPDKNVLTPESSPPVDGFSGSVEHPYAGDHKTQRLIQMNNCPLIQDVHRKFAVWIRMYADASCQRYKRTREHLERDGATWWRGQVLK